MRGHDLEQVVDALGKPIQRFVRDARVRLVLVVSSSGQVLAQYGFSGQYQVIDVAALAAAAHASSRALADLVGAGRWQHLYHAGVQQELFLGAISLPAEDLVLVAILTRDTSLGLVQLFFERLSAEVAAMPVLRQSAELADADSFEQGLQAGLKQVFLEREPDS